jgi:hypothetical protein
MITREFGAMVVLTNDQVVSTEILIELKWDGANDPLAVEAVFKEGEEDDFETVSWTFARDLLYRAMIGRGLIIGRGDVKLKRELWKENTLNLCVSSPDGHAHVELPADEVEAFLKETIDVYAIGEENVGELVDAWLKEVMG